MSERRGGAAVSGPRPLFGDPIGPWFRWFAWRPVRTVDRGWRWLRPVWRRRFQSKLNLPGPTDQWFVAAVEVKEDDRG